MIGSFAGALDEHASRRGSVLALREPGRDWSWQDLARRADALAGQLREAGVAEGVRVGLMLPNSGAFVAAFFGIARAGGVITPLSPRYRDQELRYYLEDGSAAALLAGSSELEVARHALEGLRRPPALFHVTDDGSMRLEAPGRAEGETVRADDDAAPLLHQYTSGSTGAPKRIVRSARKLLLELEQLAAVFQLDESDRFLGAAPFSHVNGLVRTLLTSVFVGGTLYPLPQFARRKVLECIRSERVTYFGGVPHMYALLAATPARGMVDLSSLRVAFSSSAPLRIEDNRRFAERYGLHVRQLYGSTETGTISVNLEPDPGNSLASVGPGLPGVSVSVVDEAGHDLAVGEEGEVAIESPWAITAYEGNEDATASSFRDGRYLSGDLGRQDATGALTLTGRKKFLINRGGFEVNPYEVEEAMQSHPKVGEVVVLGAPARHGDELVRAVIVAKEPCTIGEIIEHLRPRIADFKIPAIVEFRDELPKSAAGKVLRSRL